MLEKRKFLIVWLLGLISGFTLMISGNTLNFWLAKENIDIKTIGIFALISIPYAINFIWAPIFDTKKIPIISQTFGHRLSWILFIQVALSMVVFYLSKINPINHLFLFAIVSLFISGLASAQDTILGALRTEIIDQRAQGQISGMYIFGYRIGMLLSSSGAIYISTYIQWSLIYELFSVIILIFPIILILLSKDLNPDKTKHINAIISPNLKNKNWFSKIFNLILNILQPIGSAKYILLILIFLILYRLPDNFIGMMINPFLLHIGYDEFEIATAGKLFGITSAILGGLLASILMKKNNLLNSLFIFGGLHAVAHILFIVQEVYGKNIYLLFLVTGFESITGGMAMAAYIGFIASLCKGAYRATQYSFFSSMMGLSRSILPALSGYIVTTVGWKSFYLFTSLATIPSLIILLYLRKLYNIKRASW